ncbi:MAG: PQQ-like beta-propeller repeat protein [Planctomycetes bacterium]|nr:PQQ-like beta-propeller repeat protein [Planctomycetota bacterium]
MRPLKPAAGANVTATPVAFEDALLVPMDNGQVALVDPETGDNRVLPLQAPTAAGTKITWRRPAVTGDHFVLADQQGKLYRVGINDSPEPHLDAVNQADQGAKIVSALAAAGDTVYAVVREPTSDTVISISANDLAAGSSWPLDGRVVWGPEAVGDGVLMTTDRGKLLCFETGQKQRWTAELPYGPLTGRPLLYEGDLLLASTEGTVWRVAGADGKEIAKNEIGEPLASGPVFFDAQGGLLLLGASDGTLHVIPHLTGSGG